MTDDQSDRYPSDDADGQATRAEERAPGGYAEQAAQQPYQAEAAQPGEQTYAQPGFEGGYQQPYAQSPYAQGYGQPGYGHPAYGQPGYGQGYGHSDYAQQTFAQPAAAQTPQAAGWDTPQDQAGAWGAAPTATAEQPAPGASGTHDTTALPWHTPSAVYGSPPGEPGTPAGEQRPTKKASGRLGLLLAAAALVGLVAGGIGGVVGSRLFDGGSASSTSTTSTLPQFEGDTSPRAEGSVAAIAEAVTPAVVSIGVATNQGEGTGSGFVVRADGYILTNNHVVADAASGGTITVSMTDGKSYPGKIVGRDAAYDLAVVKVDATDLPTVTLGDSSDVKVGDLAIAIGSPLGLDGTVTAGIISALNRPVTAGSGTSSSSDTSFINAIQTDAAINPGNSGGVLLNAAGQVIGVNSAIATMGSGQESGSIGLGFAIPMNEAKRVADQLISTGKSTKPIIGVQLDPAYTGQGAKVVSVTSGGPADKAGLADGDVITQINGNNVANSTALIVAIRAMSPGDKAELTVQRGGSTETLTVTLGSDDSAN